MRFVFVWLIVVGLFTGCVQEVKGDLPISQFNQELLDENAVLIDVRTPEEFSAGHLDNSININWLASDFADKFKGIDRDKIIYVYCKVGGRSTKAQEKLQAMGYSKVVNLSGGYDTWKAKE
ncbi:Thiosulfate sulfurtransferase GlpE [Arenibacter antarcticus]|uniref:Rhodanese-like domain-containing protein n=1 Tax=Arenibacter antarcticus TaxID=2040469 RepID=A0ABW5VEH7_9FLAO|nr:rhodanese-like domain-containing protein [Arenibacter sp. H213]MCM4168475.1 rhodanese-like domain-containing protein [Arenibacter sp. H213]